MGRHDLAAMTPRRDPVEYGILFGGATTPEPCSQGHVHWEPDWHEQRVTLVRRHGGDWYPISEMTRAEAAAIVDVAASFERVARQLDELRDTLSDAERHGMRLMRIERSGFVREAQGSEKLARWSDSVDEPDDDHEWHEVFTLVGERRLP